MFLRLLFFILLSIPFFHVLGQETQISTSNEIDLDNWGFDIGFGVQPNMESPVKLSVFSPYIFSDEIRIYTQASLKTPILNIDNTIIEYQFGIQYDSPLFKGVAQGYTRIGIQLMKLNDQLYSTDLLSGNITLGLNVFTSKKSSSIAYFVEYQQPLLDNYNEDDSLPIDPNTVLNKATLLNGSIYLGVKYIF